MRKHTKIECSPAMRELNEAIEIADLLTNCGYDRASGEQLADVLEWLECPWHAADLRNKLEAVSQTQ